MVQQHYAGVLGKSVTFVVHIISIYCSSNIVEIGQHTQTPQYNEDMIASERGCSLG